MSNTNTQARASVPGTGTTPFARLALVAALGLALAACGGADEQAAAPATQAADTTGTEAIAADGATGTDAGDSAAAEAAAAEAATAEMTVDELRDAARTAYAENRLYAPDGNNAVAYYLALRERQPDDASANSALTDLLPMTVIATEQSLVREDFEEGNRLIALLARADATHPAIARLRQTSERGEKALEARLAREQVTAEEQEQRREELQRQRLEEQQEQQQEAARRLAEEEKAAEEEAARLAAEQAREEAERVAAEERRAAAREQAQRTPTAADLRPLSMQAPEYPRSALRTGQAGEVEVELIVGVDGSVSSARVIRADPVRVFDRAALSAVESWRFQPLSAPVTVRRTIAFNPAQ